jgi:uncharacterized protein YecE (DUF72 family)
MTSPPCRTGLAGWSEAVSRYRSAFPADGSGLSRYSGTFDFVEVNVTFYRAVRETTFASWAEQTPADFRFSVKLNRSVTHAARLSANAKLEQALEPMMSLGPKLAAVLIQLPPTLATDPERDAAFLERLRALYSGMVAWEPRHPSWEAPEAAHLLAEHGITPVRTTIPAAGAARAGPGQPDRGGLAVPPGTYVRLHGTPRRYYSAYSTADLTSLSQWLRMESSPSIVIFDNTASSAGVRNAVELSELLA